MDMHSLTPLLQNSILVSASPMALFAVVGMRRWFAASAGLYFVLALTGVVGAGALTGFLVNALSGGAGLLFFEQAVTAVRRRKWLKMRFVVPVLMTILALQGWHMLHPNLLKGLL